MLIISETTLRQLISTIVNTARSCRDHNGNIPIVKTIPESTLRSGALVALTIISGQPVDTTPPE